MLVVGGGSTGAGVVRDAAMRGFSAILVERGDLAAGTTGRFHGLLHSGGRYAVTDPVAARECVAENAILRRTAADCIEDTGGLFVTTKWDDPAFGDEFAEGCRETGVPLEEIPVPQALRLESRLDPTISRAFTVPDALVVKVPRTVSPLTESMKVTVTCSSVANPVAFICTAVPGGPDRGERVR